MFLKSKILIGTAIALISLPFVANAQLVSINNTGKYSTVKIADQRCAAALGKFTGPHGQLIMGDNEVRIICLGATNCSGVVYVSDSEEQVKRCEGVRAGNANLDTKRMIITQIDSYPSPYKMSGVGTNTMILSE